MSQAQKNLTVQQVATTPWQILLSGTFNIGAGRTLTLKCSSTPAYKVDSTLTLTGSGTTDVAVGTLNLGVSASGTLNLNSGTLKAPLNMAYTYSSVFNQSGGTSVVSSLDIARGSVCNFQNGTMTLGGDLKIGKNDNSTGRMTVTGGTINQTAGYFRVGYMNTSGGSGTYVQAGNSVVTANDLRIATDGNNGSVGNFSISNGTFSASSFSSFASWTSATGHIWLAGGTVTLPTFPTARGTGAYADITFDGGTLSPRASTNSYMRGLSAAYVTTNGGVIDTAGYDITISQKLQDYSGHAGCLIKKGAGTLTLSGTNTYSGATVVTNGTLTLTHSQCLSANSTVFLYSTATNNLAFNGTNTIRRLTVDGVLQRANKVYGSSTTGGAINLSPALSGSGYYYTTEGAPPKGTFVQFY
jgi:autotransporter-associated beta strand protein